jgi:hypothetical protein
MIRNFASKVAKWPPSNAWISRFLKRNSDTLKSRWTTGIDRTRHQADTEDSYCTHFELLYSKILKYDVEAQNIYNMDKKGFLLGRTSRSKRVFSKQLWEQKKVTQALQDGNCEWITTMATICADGSWIDPAIVFEAKGGLCDAWLRNVDPEKHYCFFTTSLSGWSNDEVGLAWLKNVFERCTKSKARSSYCILILDGHGSHLTEDFISFCDANKILLHVFPPHSTHSLQPLDVVMFLPLSTLYSQKLLQYLHALQGLIAVAKEDFFLLFRDAYTSSFTRDNILKAFEATGVEPRNAEVILKRFRTPTPTQDEDVEIGQHGDGNSWKDIRNLYDAAVTNKAEVLAKRLKVGMHSLQVNNELLHEENEGL